MRVDGGIGPRTVQLGVWNSGDLRMAIDQRGAGNYAGPPFRRPLGVTAGDPSVGSGVGGRVLTL